MTLWRHLRFSREKEPDDIQRATKEDGSSSASKTGRDSSLTAEQQKLAEKALDGLSSEELLDVLSPEAIPDYIRRDKSLELKKAKELGKKLTEIERLREEYEQAASKKDEDLKKRVLEGFKEIRERVAKEGLTLPDVSKVENLDEVLLQAQKGLEAVYDGYRVLRFLAEDVGKNLDQVLDAILRALAHQNTRISALLWV